MQSTDRFEVRRETALKTCLKIERRRSNVVFPETQRSVCTIVCLPEYERGGAKFYPSRGRIIAW